LVNSLLKYSEEQPRDPDGRFASGGGIAEIFGPTWRDSLTDEQVPAIEDYRGYGYGYQRGLAPGH